VQTAAKEYGPAESTEKKLHKKQSSIRPEESDAAQDGLAAD
jgi:hypothetical protein